jgi:hypothetical protein
MREMIGRLLGRPPQPPASSWNFSIGDLLEFHRRFWEPGEPNSAEEITAAELRLGQRLPQVLRAFYGGTWLRYSAEIHLSSLEDLQLEEGVLVFGREQQAAWRFGVRLGDLAHEDPPIVADAKPEQWKAEGIRLSQWLALFTLVNRPCEPPCADGTFESGEQWRIWTNSLGFIYLHVRDGMVCNEHFAGGRDASQLAKALGCREDELRMDEE